MADQKISELTALAGNELASGDSIPVVDASASETKRTLLSSLTTYLSGVLALLNNATVAALTALTGAGADSADELPIRDASASAVKRMTLAELVTYLAGSSLATLKSATIAALSAYDALSDGASDDELVIRDVSTSSVERLTWAELGRGLARFGKLVTTRLGYDMDGAVCTDDSDSEVDVFTPYSGAVTGAGSASVYEYFAAGSSNGAQLKVFFDGVELYDLGTVSADFVVRLTVWCQDSLTNYAYALECMVGTTPVLEVGTGTFASSLAAANFTIKHRDVGGVGGLTTNVRGTWCSSNPS